MQQQGVKNIALVYNKIESSELVNITHYLSKRLAELLPNVPVLDFIVNHTLLDSKSRHWPASKISQWFISQSFS